MAFNKTSSRITVHTPEQVRQALSKAQRKPLLVMAIVALIPLAALLLFTLKGGLSYGKPRKSATIEVPRQTPQEIAEEATNALRKGDTQLFFEIMDTKVKDPDLVNSRGDSLLLVAATLGNAEAVDYLLMKGANVNKQNAFTRDTPILRSMAGGYDDITRLLVYENADLNLLNNYRQSPMGLAVEKKHGAMIDLFLTKGVKAGLDGETLLRASAQKNYVGVLGMLKGGVDPNISNAQGNTPLIISASLGDTASVQTLLAYRANVHAANKDGNTALLYAARYGHPETVLELLAPLTMQYKADVNVQNNNGETALYWASIKGFAPVVQILLAYDADPSIATKSGETPLAGAKKYNRTEVIKLLQMPINSVKELFNQNIAARNAAAAERRAQEAQARAQRLQAGQ